MDLVTGAMGNLAPKLLQLLRDEYKLQKGLKKEVRSISDELKNIQGALRKVAAVPRDQLDEQVKVWADEVREASYDMDDVLDSFLVRRLRDRGLISRRRPRPIHVAVGGHEPAKDKESGLKQALDKMGRLCSRGKARHDVSGTIKDIMKQVQEVAGRRARYKVDEIIVAQPAAPSKIDPRLQAMYKEVTELIGISKSRDGLVSMLSSPHVNTKIVSVLGVGGLGKTTLVKAVYDELKPQFDCWAFVPVGRNPSLKKVFRDVLLDLDQGKYMDPKYYILDERQLINELRCFLQSKRYFIVIDDVWEVPTWNTIKSALDQKNSGSKVVTTTRNLEVAKSEEVYQMGSFSRDKSKELFYTRLFGEGKCPANPPSEATETILDKCGDVPLAIITVASLLVGKTTDDWVAVCNSSIFYSGNVDQQVHDTEWILSLSYYDLPSNLKTCLLYLSVYPEDYLIEKDCLIWKWIAEGFVEGKTGTSLYQQGEEYFNQLINRGMIQAVEFEPEGIIYGCRVHDMILDLIRGRSEEENFVTISNDDEGTSPLPKKVRRLAHQNREMKQTLQASLVDMEKVRSLVITKCDIIETWVLHPRFKVVAEPTNLL